jgi:hypothetical protein
MILLAAIALALAACNNGSSPATTTPGPSVSQSPDPDITAASIYVSLQGTPQPHVPVQISTPQSSANPYPGTPFATVTTRPWIAPSAGFARFSHLKPGVTYCWVATIPFRTPSPSPSPSPSTSPDAHTAPTPTPSPAVATFCTSNWQFDEVNLGN